MADAFLREMVAASVALPALELRIFVIAWRMTFDGIVSNADDYNEALLATIAANLKSLTGTSASVTAKTEKALVKAAGIDSSDAEDKYLHLRSARTENGGTLPWLRIPFTDVSGFALQSQHATDRVKAGF
jgi:hypothetical protein